MSTLGARLRAKLRRDLDYHLVLLRGFVVGKTDDVAPAAAQDTAIEACFGTSTVRQELALIIDLGGWCLGHVGDFQVFEGKYLTVSMIDQRVRNLVGNVLAHIGLLLSHSGYARLGFTATIGAFLLSRQFTLKVFLSALALFDRLLIVLA